MRDLETKLKAIVDEMFADEKMAEYKRHTLRVVRLCKYIGQKERANMEVLIPAAYLHDIGRVILKDIKGHVEKSVYLAKVLLKNLEYDEELIKQVIIAIEDHHKNDTVPRTLEGKVLYDADKLEIVGELGIARWFMGAAGNLTLKEAAEKYIRLAKISTKDRETFFITPTGKKLGDNEFHYSLEFCKKLLEKEKILE
jgi:uncharacterized protein